MPRKILEGYIEILKQMKARQFTINEIRPLFLAHLGVIRDDTLARHLEMLVRLGLIKVVQPGVYVVVKDVNEYDD